MRRIQNQYQLTEVFKGEWHMIIEKMKRLERSRVGLIFDVTIIKN